MTDFNLFSDLYLEANILLGLAWILWIATKKMVKTLGVESTKQKQLLITRLLFLALFVSPVMVRGLPSVSFESLRMQRESIEEVISAPLTTGISYPSEPVEPLSQISGFSLQPVEWRHGLYFLIGVGFLIQGVRLVRKIIKLRRVIYNSFRWKRIGKIHLLISEDTPVPFSTKVFGKNQIVIPSALLVSPENLRVVLAHEGQHLRNGDLFWEILMEGVKLICYWNPAVYAWKAELDRIREFACDESLMGRQQISSYVYGNCLLQVAESFSSPQFLLAGTASMGLNSFFHENDSSQLKRRLKMLETQKKIRRSQLKAGILGGMLLLCIVLLATIIFGSSSNAAEEDIPDAILAASQQFVTAYGQADLDVMMTFLTRDARWFFPLGNTFSGVEEIKNIYETGIRHGTAKIELERLHLEVHGNTATEFRRFLHRRADGSIQSWGLSTVIWKIEDDKWKIHRLTWLPKG